MKKTLSLKFFILSFWCLFVGCGHQDKYRTLSLPVNLEVLYDTTKPENEYKFQSVAYSLAPVYELNKKVYSKYYSDSLQTDLCFVYYYAGSDWDKVELGRRLKDVHMYNTIVYWDKEKKFAELNGLGKDIHFIGYVVDERNRVLKMANPTILSFSEENLNKLRIKE